MTRKNNVAKATRQFKAELAQRVKDIVMDECGEYFPQLTPEHVEVELSAGRDGLGFMISIPFKSLGISRRKANRVMNAVAQNIDTRVADLVKSQEAKKEKKLVSLEQERKELALKIIEKAKESGLDPIAEWKKISGNVKTEIYKALCEEKERKEAEHKDFDRDFVTEKFLDFFEGLVKGMK